jgi:hypothetical protein
MIGLPRSWRLDRERGQALAEYTVITAAVVVALVVPFPAALFPPSIAGKSFMTAMLDAYQAYYTSFYYVLNLPFP